MVDLINDPNLGDLLLEMSVGEREQIVKTRNEIKDIYELRMFTRFLDSFESVLETYDYELI